MTCSLIYARALLQSEYQHLRERRYVVVPNWLTSADTAALQRDAVAVDLHSGFDSPVGSPTADTVRHDPRVRNSRQCNLYPPPSNAAGRVNVRSGLINAVTKLREELQEVSTELQLPHLEPFSTELSYLSYPIGGHYKRHLDQPYSESGWVRRGRRAADGGSFVGRHTRRVVSVIVYLNSGWHAADGGCLRVFPAHEHAHGFTEGETVAHAEDVLPEGGTLVLLMSGDVEHLVQETHAARQCVVGWFHETKLRPVPDLSVTSLRTLRGLSGKATRVSVELQLGSGLWS